MAKAVSMMANLVLAPIAFPTGIVLCWFYFYVYAVNGTLGYFSGISIFKWIPYILAGLLLIKAMLLLKRSVKFASVNSDQRMITSHLFELVLIWMAFSLLTSFVNGISVAQLIVGAKQYILMWGVFVLLAVTNISYLYLERIWKMFLVIMVVQVPVVLFQYIYYVGFRLQSGSENNDAAWDSIVGTFGGDASAGGNSAGLAFFVTLMLVFVLGLRRKHQISGLYTALILGSVLLVMMFAEIKIIFVMVPIGLLLLYRGDIIRRPVKAMIGGALICIVMGMVFSNYQSLYYSSGKASNIQEQISGMTDSLMKEDLIIDETGEMGRLTSMVFWWNENSHEHGLINTMIGHGMLSSRSVSLFLTDNLAASYALHIDRTGLVILLWDFGVVGVAIYLMILIYGALLSFRLAKNDLIPSFHRVALETGAIGLLLTIIALIHHPSPIVAAVSQSMMIFFLGQCMYWQRNLLNLYDNAGGKNSGMERTA